MISSIRLVVVNITGMNFLFISHASTLKGLIDYFEEFLLLHGHKSIKLAHPLDSYTDQTSDIFKNGVLVNRVKRQDMSIFNYIYDLYLTLRQIWQNKFDVYVGADNFDAFAGILGKILFSRSYKVIYYGSDFSEERFHSKLLDAIYLWIEKIVLRTSEMVISNTQRAESKRLQLGLKKKKSYIIPNCISVIKKPRFFKKTIDKRSFIYIGHVTNEHGLLELITIMRPLIHSLVIIGDGEQWNDLVRLVKHFKIKTRFYRAKDHDFVINYLEKFKGFGLAPYNQKEKWTYYCSPLKIYEYLVTGIPVITSDRTEISETIRKDSLGLVYHKATLTELELKINLFDDQNFFQKAKIIYLQHSPNCLYKPVIEALEAMHNNN